MSALTTRCTNPKILLASPGASTHVPVDTIKTERIGNLSIRLEECPFIERHGDTHVDQVPT
jgi:hypothetical protein